MGVLSTMAVLGIIAAGAGGGAAAARVLAPKPSNAQAVTPPTPPAAMTPPTPPNTLATMSQNQLQARDAAGRQRRRAKLPGAPNTTPGGKPIQTIAAQTIPKTLLGY
jgi:hypothetical protein